MALFSRFCKAKPPYSETAQQVLKLPLTSSADCYALALIGHTSWRIPDYYCFVESDVFFVPENFKRYLRVKNFTDSNVPRMLGHVWNH